MAQPMRPTRPTSLARAFAAAVALLLAFPNAARAIHHNVTLLGETQCTNDTAIQLVRVRMDSPDAFSWNNCVKLTFQNAAGVLTGEFAIHQDPPAGNGLVVGIGTAELASTPGAPPIHLVIPSNLMNPNGSVCYRGIKGNTHIPDGRGCSAIDLCVPVTQATCGCDHLPNSGKTLDRCGVCGGNGSTCGCGNGIVDPGEQCDGGPCCSASCTFLPATTVCRAAAGDCDLAETCTGVSNACPADASKAAGTTCTDDGNPCTLDVCDGASTTCRHPAGNAGAVCRPAASPCDLAEACDGTSTTCPADAFAAAGTPCRGAAGECDVAELCSGTGPNCPADAKQPAGTACTEDGNPCTADQCDGTRVTCQHPAGNAGAVCRPAAGICDLAESCDGARPACPPDGFAPSSVVCRAAAGVCDVADLCPGNGPTCPADSVGPAGTACPDDGNACTLDQCDGTSVTCRHPPASAGTVCRPAGAPCDVAEVCDGTGGNCPGDSFLSAATECRPAAGPCDVAEFCPGNGPTCPLDAKLPNGSPCSDGSLCTTGDTCQAGLCTGTPVACPASDQCHVAGTCDPATGTCPNPVAANGTACNDGNACTTGDTCQAGVCAGTAVTCPASDQCHLAGTCDPATGACSNPPAPNGTACNDGNACTTADSCQGGGCQGTAVVCPAPDQCHTAGTCNPLTGACSNPPVANGTACSDGNACTTADTCQAGVCRGAGIVCPAPDQCHTGGSCDPVTGTCPNPQPVADGTICNDANACTTGDTCQAGACSGRPVVCTVLDQCHGAGTCNPVTGTCSNPPVPNGTACSDGNGCTSGDSCQAGLCTGTAVACTAQDQCHAAGTCNPATATCSNPPVANGTICNDGNACTTGDNCQAGVCRGTGVVCAALDQCHVVGTCDPATATCSHPAAPDGTPCNDGDACTVRDTCAAGSCVGEPVGPCAANAAAVVEADSFVDAATPARNFGATTRLEVDASPRKQTFFRIRVSGVGARQVTSARLRLQVSNVPNSQSVAAGRIHPITACGWDEQTVTWKTRPAIDGPVLSTLGAVALGQVLEFDVTSAIQGDGVYCFAIESPSADGVRYNSREAAAGKPEVIIGVGSQAPATTTTTTTLPPAAPAVGAVLADTYVQSDLATTHFGAKPVISVDNGVASNPGTTGVQHTFLRVSVSGVGAKHVSSAHLQLEVANVTNAGSVSGGSIHAITNCTWDELTMTWNTAPPIDGPALVTLGAVAAGQGVDFDVTAAIPGDGVYCFAIDTTSTDSAIYNSREGSGVPPALVVQVAP